MQDKKKISSIKKKALISVVIPVFNEEDTIDSFYKSISEFLKTSKQISDIEIIFIDDGSKDGTAKKINSIRLVDNRVKLISFTKNHGVNTAFSAGLDFATGDCLIFLDADNQYPITILDDFVRGWKNNNKIIFAKRRNYRPKRLFKFMSVIFTKFINVTSSISLDNDTSYVCLIDRHIIEILKSLNEKCTM